MNILQNIFRDHYEELIYITHPRPSVVENVDKMINCGDPAFGGAMYGCPKCGELMMSHRVCKNCGTYNKKEIIAKEA